jgi:hypothetical protein
MGDPLVILANKGITKDNKTDIIALAAAIHAIIPLAGSNYSIKKLGADQLTAICTLLEEAQHLPMPQGDDAPVTKKQLDEALQCLTVTLHAAPAHPSSDSAYAGVT